MEFEPYRTLPLIKSSRLFYPLSQDSTCSMMLAQADKTSDIELFLVRESLL